MPELETWLRRTMFGVGFGMLLKNSIFISSVIFAVSGVDITFSREKVFLGSTGTLTMSCNITETNVGTIHRIMISTLLRSTPRFGSYWKTVAKMDFEKGAITFLSQDIEDETGRKDYVARGSWDSTTPTNTYLTLSMNIEKLVCDDVRAYKFILSYKSSTTGGTVWSYKNGTFSAYCQFHFY
jgi:hypothetical protein